MKLSSGGAWTASHRDRFSAPTHPHRLTAVAVGFNGANVSCDGHEGVAVGLLAALQAAVGLVDAVSDGRRVTSSERHLTAGASS